MSVKAPELMLSEDISRTPPSKKVVEFASVSKLFRKRSWAKGDVIAMDGESSRLSLMPF
jgi:hypothetical protein